MKFVRFQTDDRVSCELWEKESIIEKALGASFAATVTQPDEIIPTTRKAVQAMASGKPALINFVTAEDDVFPMYHNQW